MLARLRAKRPNSSLWRLLLYEFACVVVLRPIFRVFYRARIEGVQRVPVEGPLLIVANHQSYFDPPFIGCWITWRHFEFVARAGLFKNRFFGALISAVNAMPISEEGGDVAAVKETLRKLNEGRGIMIFPEGSRTNDGTIGEFKRGAELLLRRSRCPVVPVAIEGVYDAFPRGRKFPRLFGCRIAVRFGEPIPHDELVAKDGSPPLDRIRAWIDENRLELRAGLRERTRGRYPPPGPADGPSAATTNAG